MWLGFYLLITSAAAASVLEFANSVTMLYTSVRMVVLGVGDTYVMIWEDGFIGWDLEHHYDALDEIWVRSG